MQAPATLPSCHFHPNPHNPRLSREKCESLNKNAKAFPFLSSGRRTQTPSLEITVYSPLPSPDVNVVGRVSVTE